MSGDEAATIRLTTAQALVRWLAAQRSELLDGTEAPLFGGVFAIFGHGNVLGLGTALAECRAQLHGVGRGGLRPRHRSAAGDGRDVLDRAGRAEYGDGRRGGACQPVAGAAVAR